MLKVYNTLSRKKEILKPREGKKINFYVCGVTPYDFAHLGHARTYIAFDMIVRWLREKKYDVFYLQNITDIDDKIIKRAEEKGISTEKLAKIFEKEYLKDMRLLKVKTVTKYTRATDYIKEIISEIQQLVKRGFAYQTDDGIYYDISKFKDYGKLSGRTIIQAEDGVSRIDDSDKKKNKGDFCLWKLSKPGEPKWKSPFGWGRPGWHIECSVMSKKYLGEQFDIHGGAQDLIFPHHEAEIAQTEAVSGKTPFVKYWFHSGFLTINGQKMSKSLVNFITIKAFLKKNSPRILRFLILKNHYRSPLNYNEKLIIQTEKELGKIDEFITNLKIKNEKQKRVTKKFKLLEFKKEFKEAMDNDFNTPKAIATVFKLINKGNFLIDKNLLSETDIRKILDFLKKTDKIFNFIFWDKVVKKIPKDILNLAKEREESRKNKEWQKADKIRIELNKRGYLIKDTDKGPKIKSVNSEQ